MPLLGIAILQGLLFERIPKSLFLRTNLTHQQMHNLVALRDLALEVLRSCSSLLGRMKLRNNKYLQEVFKLKSVLLKGIWMRTLKLKFENSIKSWKNTRKLHFLYFFVHFSLLLICQYKISQDFYITQKELLAARDYVSQTERLEKFVCKLCSRM